MQTHGHSKTSLTLVALALAVATTAAQSRIVPPDNKYTPEQDVELGRKSAAEVEQQLPILHDEILTSYVQGVGRRLVDAVPSSLRHPEFHYTFQVVNVREINAFALPGGPMFVNRGMLSAARTEGEVAGVMAHELSHVVLRHGTAQASKATKYEVGALAGAVLGAIIGGNMGAIVAQGTRFGIGTAFLRFSREFEKQADLEGAQIMARAGYDPRDMANVFRTIESQSGGGGPEWLSDHPNPGNRIEYLTEEARLLRVENPVRDTRAFEEVQARIRSMPPAPTTEEATRTASRRQGGDTGAPPSGRVSPPARRTQTYREGDLFTIAVPANWRELPGSSASVTFAPDGAYGTAGGRSVFTHGLQVGVARNERHDLQTATDELVDALREGNPQLRRTSDYGTASLGGRRGLTTLLSNVSDATGQPETIQVFTTTLGDGQLFYVLGVAPRDEFRTYEPAFAAAVGSLRFADY